MLKSGPGSPASPTIGNRSLHHYWALLKTHFRSVLLAPQSLADGANTQWTWREPADGASLTAAELATVRKRLTGSQRSLADSVEDARDSTADAGSVLPQLQARMESVVEALVALPDSALAAYVARSEHGPLLHSWGLLVALTPHHPDNTECEISGRVLVSHAPAPDREILLENLAGTTLDRTRSDAAGRFRFAKVSPGSYRAHAISDRESFPIKGVLVEIDAASVEGIELHDTSLDPTAAASRTSTRRRRVIPFILFGSIAAVIAVTVWWRSGDSASPPAVETTATAHANVAHESFTRSPDKRAEAESPRSRVATTTTPNPPLNADKTREPALAPAVSANENEPARGPKRSTIVFQRRAGGSADESSGAPTNSAAPSSGPTAGTAGPGLGAAASSGTGVSAAGGAAVAGAASNGTGAATVSPPGSAAPSSSAVPVAKALPSTPARPKPPAPTTAQAATASHPTPHPPAPNPTPDEAPPSATADSPSASAASATPDSPPSATPTPDAVPEKAAAPDITDLPGDDRSRHQPAPSGATTVTSIVTTSDDPATNPSPDSAAPLTNNTDRIVGIELTPHSFRARLRVTPWQTRLLNDQILPTAPTRVGEGDAIAALRERLIRECRAQIPPMFNQPRTRIGFAIELFRATTTRPQPHWIGQSPTTTTSATVDATHAEISWPDNAPPETACTLVTEEGRELARVTADDRGAFSLATAIGLRGWAWIAVDRPTGAEAHLTARDWTTRLDWRVVSGAPAAPTWRRDDHWLDDHGHRLDLDPGEKGNAPARRTLALVDRVSGWAIVSDIELAQERPDSIGARAP